MEIQSLHEDKIIDAPEASVGLEVIDRGLHAVRANLVFQPASDGYMQNLGSFEASM